MIRSWISSVLSKIIDYKAQHRGILIEAEASLMQLLPHEMVKGNVLPFIELPAHTFHGEDINVVIKKPKVIGKIDKGGNKDGGALRRFLVLAPKAIHYPP